ncbi:sensor histidine kinase [Actinomadura oligospora]|uniref:sensor histidine kinase n=1 Tax=Actinomadura oligospora TaxID=111804 RepID=UPI0004AEF61E|nr:sensor histidine kinase [Actinomadura oligospora]
MNATPDATLDGTLDATADGATTDATAADGTAADGAAAVATADGAVTDGAASWQRRLLNGGPFVLLGVGGVLATVSADALMTPGRERAAIVLAVAALALQAWWSLVGGRRRPRGPAHRVYYLLRWAAGFALTWCNPLFGVYALLGYYDAGRLLPRHLVRPALFATAVTMAGSNAGGLPPTEGRHWLAFVALLALHAGLALGFDHIAVKDAEQAASRAAALAEARLANVRLARALQENAGLHAQLLVQAREAGVADERRRLAAEIHDTLAQGLTGIVTQLQAAADSADPATTRDHVQRASALARHSLGEARRSVQDLGPAQLEQDPLPTALEKVVKGWSDETGVQGEFVVTGTAEPLHDEIEAALLRIVQEALTNVARHADARRTGVTLSYMDDEVSLDVRDDGGGFDPRTPPARDHTGGFGLSGMRARAERVAGTLIVESAPGFGTALSAQVPLVRHD